MTDELKIICPFCNAPYDAVMRSDLYTAGGCETCGPSIEGEIKVVCTNCKKVVYKKEY